MGETKSSRDARAAARSALTNGLDLYAGLLEHWIEWQSGLWQPFADAQAEWVRLWQARFGWPEFVPLRGVEQLG